MFHLQREMFDGSKFSSLKKDDWKLSQKFEDHRNVEAFMPSFCEIPKFLRKCLPGRPSGIQGVLALLPGKTRIASRVTHNEEITVLWGCCISSELGLYVHRRGEIVRIAVNYSCCPAAYAYKPRSVREKTQHCFITAVLISSWHWFHESRKFLEIDS